MKRPQEDSEPKRVKSLLVMPSPKRLRRPPVVPPVIEPIAPRIRRDEP
ncbi:MAG: hypothetical protein AAGI17_09435 [Planctomycetota bacterium]